MQNPLESITSAIPVAGFVSVVFAIIFVWWVIYTLILIYHWYRFSRDSWFFAPTIMAHIIVSALIVIYIIAA